MANNRTTEQKRIAKSLFQGILGGILLATGIRSLKSHERPAMPVKGNVSAIFKSDMAFFGKVLLNFVMIVCGWKLLKRSVISLSEPHQTDAPTEELPPPTEIPRLAPPDAIPPVISKDEQA